MMDEDNSAAEWAAGSQLQEESVLNSTLTSYFNPSVPLETTTVRLRKDFF
jgi:hypothetical protein